MGCSFSTLLSHLPFSPLHEKCWLLLAILIICLSRPPLRNMTAQTSTTSLLSSSLLSPRWKLFSADEPPWALSARPAHTCVATFSSSVCCILWFIYTSLIVAPRACQESQSRHLSMCIMRPESNSYLKYTWMHEYIYRRDGPVHWRESHFL